MELKYTKQMMEEKKKNSEFDTYAVLVGIGDEECLIHSPNVDEATYFDMASVGKILVTTPLTLRAFGKGLLRPEDTLEKFFSNVPPDKKEITVEQILIHTDGLVRVAMSPELLEQGSEAVAADILAQPLRHQPGAQCFYDDSGLVMLGFILEKCYGKGLDEAFEEQIKTPLGLERVRFGILPGEEENIAITYRRDEAEDSMIDDEHARYMRGVIGAGASFWSLSALRQYVKAVLRRDERLYPKEWFAEAEKNHTQQFIESRGLGYEVVTEQCKQTGTLFPDGSFGHTGFTGQSLFINRETGLYVILLTNATRFAYKHTKPGDDYYAKTKRLREQIHNEIHKDLSNL